MAKKIITNPEFEKAPYELKFINAKGEDVLQFSASRGVSATPVIHRFNRIWPDDLKAEDLAKWVYENAIPQYIEVEDAANPVS